MIAWEAPVEAVAAGVAAAVTLVTLARHGFRHAVQDIVNKSHADLVVRQVDFERRQGRHLDAQDARLERIERKLNQRLRQPVVSTSGSTGGPGGTSYHGSSLGVASSRSAPGTGPRVIRVCSANVSSPRTFTTSSRTARGPATTYPTPSLERGIFGLGELGLLEVRRVQ